MLSSFLVLCVTAVALLASVQPVSATNFTQFSLCYQFISKPYASSGSNGSLDTQYAVATELFGFYNATVGTATGTGGTVAGQYVTLVNITHGLRQYRTRYNTLYNSTVQALLPPAKGQYQDNYLYVSNDSSKTGQWVDDNGITFNFTSSTEFPGKEYSNSTNIYRVGGKGLFVESTSSAVSNINTNFRVNGVTGFPGYPKGSCNPATVTKQTQFSSLVSPIPVSYYLTNSANWSVTFNGTFSFPSTKTTDDFGDNYYTLTGATGNRTYCTFAGLGTGCVTNKVVTIAPIKTFGFVDNRVYLYYPYLDYNGPGYTLNATVVKPGYPLGNTVNTTLYVNFYFSKGGYFFEGFGAGGTGPNGDINTAATQVYVYGVPV